MAPKRTPKSTPRSPLATFYNPRVCKLTFHEEILSKMSHLRAGQKFVLKTRHSLLVEPTPGLVVGAYPIWSNTWNIIEVSSGLTVCQYAQWHPDALSATSTNPGRWGRTLIAPPNVIPRPGRYKLWVTSLFKFKFKNHGTWEVWSHHPRLKQDIGPQFIVR